MTAHTEEGHKDELVIKYEQSFTLDEQTSELRKKNLPNILYFINKIVK